MSRSTRMFVSREDLTSLADQATPSTTQTIDGSQSADAPLFELHGVGKDSPVVTELKSAVIEPDAIVVANDPVAGADGNGITIGNESQQIDAAVAADAEEKAVELAKLAEQSDAIANRNKVFILSGNDLDEGDDGLQQTFSALATSALEDPTHTVAAFLPVDAGAGVPQPGNERTRELEWMQQMLREQNVPCVHSLEALAEHLNYRMEGHHRLTLSTEGVKALRPGMKVRYSHGHGRIQKILDRPTPISGTMHHASKEKPLYVVKADKGGHVSVHKASALTPV